MVEKLLKGNSTDGEKWPSLHDIDGESLRDLIANATREEIDPDVYEIPIF